MGPDIVHDKNKAEFRVFAFNKKGVNILIKKDEEIKSYPMALEEPHIYSTHVEGLGFNFLYKFRIEEGDYPDPYSHYQPEGVHGYSQLIDHNLYQWQDQEWTGKNLEELIIMEIHIGTFTEAGTFRAAVDKLPYLTDLKINTLELMPVVQTPGKRNWGYDGSNLFTVNNNYGTPDDLKYFIDSCHQKQIAVIQDVVYNHLGPEGNYLSAYGPYFTSKYKTDWGSAVNYDDNYNEFTCNMVLDNVRYWLENYHFDGLRLDAVHAIRDESEPHILAEIKKTAQETASKLQKKLWIIAESDENNVGLINPPEKGGYGIDAIWMDDFHHSIHASLTGEQEGYYKDYGHLEDLEKIYKNFLYTGQYSKNWDRERGTDAAANPGKQFVVALQNHDQIGNRAHGERLSTLIEFPYLKIAAGLLFFSPYIPLLFMGEEYAEKNPFLFFTDFQDPELQAAVSHGRKEEFKDFNWENVPDPQDPQTFFKCKLTKPEEWQEENKQMFKFYRDMINLRISHPVLKNLDKENLEVKIDAGQRLVVINRWQEKIKLTGLFNLGDQEIPLKSYPGKQLLNSFWKIYGGEEEGNSNCLRKGQMLIIESPITETGKAN